MLMMISMIAQFTDSRFKSSSVFHSRQIVKTESCFVIYFRSCEKQSKMGEELDGNTILARALKEQVSCSNLNVVAKIET